MLVCNVSQGARRSVILADIAEAAVALDSITQGQVVFAALVDDPANVLDQTDAYLGEIMLEAASAADVVDSGLAYAVDVVEAATADAAADAEYAYQVIEAASAADTSDGTVISAPTSATWESATVANASLSGGNLVVTNSGTTSGDQGARVASASGKSSGKYYFEVTTTTVVSAGGGNCGIGVATTASTYTNMGNNATSGAEVFCNNGGIYGNGSSTGFIGVGAFASGNVICCAIDLDNHKAWFRKGASGLWNGMSAHDPAANTAGAALPSGTLSPICTFGGSGGTTGNVFTANFGATAFTGTAPSGFTSGWPS